MSYNQPDKFIARVAELVDALVLGTSGVTRESSSLSFRTMYSELIGVLLPTKDGFFFKNFNKFIVLISNCATMFKSECRKS